MKVQRSYRICWGFLLLMASLLATGCTLGPRQITQSRLQYNEAVQQTFEEEVLLNLVRLKYRETPEFVTVTGVAAQYSFDGGASIGGGLEEGAGDALAIGGSFSRSEKPTITYAPMRDEASNRGMLAPVSLETLVLLARTGWRWDRILRLSVQNINGIDNATTAGGPTPDLKPEFEKYLELCENLQKLQTRREVELTFASKEDRKVVPIPISQLDGDFVLDAIGKGYEFERNGESVVLVQDDKYIALVLKPQAIASIEMDEIAAMLNLERGRAIYEVDLAKEGQIQPAYPPELYSTDTPVINPSVVAHNQNRQDLTVSTRSILEMMFYLSQAVQVPQRHLQGGVVTATVDKGGNLFDWSKMTENLFQVHVTDTEPECAAVAIPYRGCWYYIDDKDLDSQSTFALLAELISIEIRGGGGGNMPVLTLGI